jgi:WD40 repeat protein
LNISAEEREFSVGEALSPMALVFNPASIDGVRSWTIETIGHRGPVYSLAYSPDGRLLASACADGVIRLWNCQDGRFERALLGHGDAVRAVTWSPDGKYLASGSDDTTVRLWEAGSGRLLRTLVGHTHEVFSVAWSPQGRLLASGSRHSMVRVWDVLSGETLQNFAGGSQCGAGVVWSPDGKTLACAAGTYVKVWKVGSEEPQFLAEHTLTGTAMTDPAWSPDGQYLAASAWRKHKRENSINFWSAETGALITEHRQIGPGDSSLAWSPDGQALLAGLIGVPRSVRVYGLTTGSIGRAWGKPPDRWGTDVFSVAYSPDGATWAAADRRGTVQICDGESYQPRLTLPGGCGALMPDGRLIGVEGESADRLRFLQNGTLAHTAIVLLKDQQHVVISPHGHCGGAAGVGEELVYVVQTDRGQATLTPEVFAKEYGWTNDPTQCDLK